MSRAILIIGLMATMVANLYGANDPFPVPITGNNIRDAYLNTGEWDRKLIGLAGVIQELKKEIKASRCFGYRSESRMTMRRLSGLAHW